ncbi:MAG: ribulose-phosphate 3-epimerase [Longicatena sp.]
MEELKDKYMKKYGLSPSLMCINIENLKEELSKLDNTVIDSYHIDIMDANYVANFALGIGDVWAVQRLSSKPFDIHLMVENPDCMIDLLNMEHCQTIYVHLDSCKHPHRTLAKIKGMNKRAGIVLNPGSSVQEVNEYLEIIDDVLLMSVNPGYAGQKFLTSSYDKLDRLKKILKNANHSINVMIDGAINKDNISKLAQNGANSFVLGTASLFKNDNDYEKNIRELLSE